MANYLKSIPPENLPHHAGFEDIVRYLQDQNIRDRDGKQTNWMLRHFNHVPRGIAKVAQALQQNGLSHFDLIGMGARSIILAADHDQIVRITLDRAMSDASKELKHPAILQPIKVIPVRSTRLIRIEVTPQVDFGNITKDDEYEVLNVLASSRIYCADMIGNENVGAIEVNGKRVPLLVDYGQLEMGGIPDGGIDKTLIRNWLSEDNMLLQKLYDPRIGSGHVTPEGSKTEKAGQQGQSR